VRRKAMHLQHMMRWAQVDRSRNNLILLEPLVREQRLGEGAEKLLQSSARDPGMGTLQQLPDAHGSAAHHLGISRHLSRHI